MKTLGEKIDFAVKLLKSIPQDNEIEISFSGGKDSEVILELAKMAQIPFRAIYKNTTIDPPGTIAHCKSKNVEIFPPAVRFFDLVRRKGPPTRRARYCCDFLKEYKVLNRAVQGIRKCESVKRAARYDEPEVCRIYGNKSNVCQVYYPILQWSDNDVERFIKERGITCHPLYYDENGIFHVERRLGCIGCPLRGDNGRSDFLIYPKFLKLLIKETQAWMDERPYGNAVRKFGNAYGLLYHNLFCKSYSQFENLITGGLFPELAVDCKLFLEQYFKIDLNL